MVRKLRRCWRVARGRQGDRGMSTAEYAVGTIAAASFAAVLFKILTSGTVSSELQEMIARALDASL